MPASQAYIQQSRVVQLYVSRFSLLHTSLHTQCTAYQPAARRGARHSLVHARTVITAVRACPKFPFVIWQASPPLCRPITKRARIPNGRACGRPGRRAPVVRHPCRLPATVGLVFSTPEKINRGKPLRKTNLPHFTTSSQSALVRLSSYTLSIVL